MIGLGSSSEQTFSRREHVETRPARTLNVQINNNTTINNNTVNNSDEPEDKSVQNTSKAVQILPGGYIGELDISASSGWQQINNEKRRGMRLNKRQKPRAQWQRSAL